MHEIQRKWNENWAQGKMMVALNFKSGSILLRVIRNCWLRVLLQNIVSLFINELINKWLKATYKTIVKYTILKYLKSIHNPRQSNLKTIPPTISLTTTEYHPPNFCNCCKEYWYLNAKQKRNVLAWHQKMSTSVPGQEIILWRGVHFETVSSLVAALQILLIRAQREGSLMLTSGSSQAQMGKAIL